MLKLTALVLLLTISSYFCEHVEITPTIVGGRNATLGQFPYMVSLRGKVSGRLVNIFLRTRSTICRICFIQGCSYKFFDDRREGPTTSGVWIFVHSNFNLEGSFLHWICIDYTLAFVYSVMP